MLLTTAALQHEKQYPDCGNDTANKNCSRTYENLTHATVPPIAGVITPPRNQHPKRDEYRSEQDLQAQWDMSRWTFAAALAAWAGVFVTVLGIILVWQTLEANRAAVQVARDIGEAQVRAYIVSEGAAFSVTEQSVEYKIRFKNIGQSPAFDIKVRCVAWLIPPKGVTQTFECFSWGAPVISCGATEEYLGFFNIEGNPAIIRSSNLPKLPEIPASIAAVLRTGERRHFSIRVTIGWTDVFKRRQNITFEYTERDSRTIHSEDGSISSREGEFGPGQTSHYRDNIEPKQV